MGYGGYVSAKLPPPKPTDAEAACLAVKSLEAIEMVHKLVYNASVQPKEDKFRKVRLSNPKVQAVLGTSNGVEALLALGWAQEEVEGETFLSIPAGKYMSMQQVRTVESARDRLSKDLKDQARHNNVHACMA